jgi:predicted DNA binding CopG/RHH family protein
LGIRHTNSWDDLKGFNAKDAEDAKGAKVFTKRFNAKMLRNTQYEIRPMGLPLRADQLEAIKKVARRKGIPFEALIRSWLLEKLRQEAPELLREHR